MKTVEMLVTPTQAVKWLEGNVHNRVIRSGVVERYARDMKAGKWRLTHQGIAFDENHVLVDGQHRLFALMEADVSVPFMVSFGVSLDAQAVIDDNLPRTMVDVLKISYGKDDASNMHVAIAKRLRQSGMLAAKSKKLTRQEIIAAMEEHETAISFALTAFPRKVRAISVAPVLTVVARAWYTQQRERLARFCEVLATGRAHEGEDAAIMLRNWLVEKTPVRGKAAGSRADAIYGKTERALSAFLDGESLGILYTASTELFPLPEERKVRPTKAAPKKKVVIAEGIPAPRLRRVKVQQASA